MVSIVKNDEEVQEHLEGHMFPFPPVKYKSHLKYSWGERQTTNDKNKWNEWQMNQDFENVCCYIIRGKCQEFES